MRKICWLLVWMGCLQARPALEDQLDHWMTEVGKSIDQTVNQPVFAAGEKAKQTFYDLKFSFVDLPAHG